MKNNATYATVGKPIAKFLVKFDLRVSQSSGNAQSSRSTVYLSQRALYYFTHIYKLPAYATTFTPLLLNMRRISSIPEGTLKNVRAICVTGGNVEGYIRGGRAVHQTTAKFEKLLQVREIESVELGRIVHTMNHDDDDDETMSYPKCTINES